MVDTALLSRSFGQERSLSPVVQLTLKRLTDMVLSFLAILVLSPLYLLLGLLVKLTSGEGPVIYQSLRIGKDYRPFYMYKFRTMRPDADDLRDDLRKEAQLEGQLFKIANDPRVTWIGHFLRATSLDELPQLFNVLKGDMSLVGPRPLPPDESQLFEGPYRKRFNVMPGVTGLWQISGRSSLSFEQLCKLELTYVMRWNVWNDLKILFKTVPVVLLRSGAY